MTATTTITRNDLIALLAENTREMGDVSRKISAATSDHERAMLGNQWQVLRIDRTEIQHRIAAMTPARRK